MDGAGGARLQARRSHRHDQAARGLRRHHRRIDSPCPAGNGAPMSTERIVQPAASKEEEAVDRAIRPKKLTDYVGQEQVKAQLEIFVQAAVKRGEALDHALIFGPPGLGTAAAGTLLATPL